MLFTLPVFSQGNIHPMAGEVLLSGSFGELRATHFHSGIDIRTGGREGLPVRVVNDGKLVRVFVSAVGYGNALYIEHPDGKMTVYGHLQRFNPEIREMVRRFQYAEKSFYVDKNVRKANITFKKGDIIGYSGDSGSSGGPHLHFEYRQSSTEVLLNPLRYVDIEDHIAPKPITFYIYTVTADGFVKRLKAADMRQLAEKRYTSGTVEVPAGKIGIAAHVIDYMNNSSNKLGVYKMRMTVDGEKKFDYTVDSCTFSSRRLINEIKDFNLYNDNSKTVYRTFGFYLNRIPGVEAYEDGLINVATGETKKVELDFVDYAGNKSFAEIRLKGVAGNADTDFPLLRYDSNCVLTVDALSMQLGSEVLFSSVRRVARTDSLEVDDLKYKVYLTAEEEIPLMQPVRLHINGEFDDKSVIFRINDKKETKPLTTYHDAGGIYALTDMLGCYAVKSDTVAPTIELLNVRNGVLKFEIKDDFSGINTYKGEVNGEWCLFEYDAKNDIYSSSTDEPAFIKGENRVVITVSDEVGNVTRKIFSIKL